MSKRSTSALLFGGALLLLLVPVFYWNPLAGSLALLSALLGLLFARLAFQPVERKKETVLAGNALEDKKEKETHDLKAARRPYGSGDLKAVSPSLLLDAMMNSMREAVLVVDDAMRVVASNRAAREVFTSSDVELGARRLSEITRNPQIHSVFRSALEDGERGEAKVEITGAQRRTFDLRIAPLRMGARAETRGAIGVFFDITQLERLEQVRKEFLSNVSHELRTPLTAIIAFVETLEDGAIDEPENNRRFLFVIRKNATRMHNLIDDILELSAIEDGTVPVEPQALRLRPAVEDILMALASRAEGNSVTLHNEVGADVIVYADARRLEQMLTNLVDNAIKFNCRGGLVTIRHEVKAGRDLISVTDTGEGLAPEHVERIFERFYRVDRARSRELGGTGLGLAIVKHLARAHGGEASVSSRPGEGSTFTIELPSVINQTKMKEKTSAQQTQRSPHNSSTTRSPTVR